MTEQIDPLLTVIVPLPNHTHNIDEAIESALGQDIRPLECTAVAEGSTDGRADVIARHPLRYIRPTHGCNQSRDVSTAHGDDEIETTVAAAAAAFKRMKP